MTWVVAVRRPELCGVIEAFLTERLEMCGVIEAFLILWQRNVVDELQ